MITVTVDIPALNRLCDLLEKGKLPSFPSGFQEVEPTDDHPWKEELTPTQEPAPTAPAAAPEPVPGDTPTVTLVAIQKACAALRDQGKMAEIKAIFPEFGIKKLSELKTDEQLTAFGARLKAMGASL